MVTAKRIPLQKNDILLCRHIQSISSNPLAQCFVLRADGVWEDLGILKGMRESLEQFGNFKELKDSQLVIPTDLWCTLHQSSSGNSLEKCRKTDFGKNPSTNMQTGGMDAPSQKSALASQLAPQVARFLKNNRLNLTRENIRRFLHMNPELPYSEQLIKQIYAEMAPKTEKDG